MSHLLIHLTSRWNSIMVLGMQCYLNYRSSGLEVFGDWDDVQF